MWLKVQQPLRGRLCSCFQVPMTVVFGKPIVLPKIDNPTESEIRKYLGLYIAAMEGICERHKVQAGYGDTRFTVL